MSDQSAITTSRLSTELTDAPSVEPLLQVTVVPEFVQVYQVVPALTSLILIELPPTGATFSVKVSESMVPGLVVFRL